MFKKILYTFKNHNVYLINKKDNSKKLVKEFKKDFLAREYVREQLEYSLKLMSFDTKNEWTLSDDFSKQRKAKFIINNDDFNEDAYIKEIAPRVYDQFLERIIDGGFEKFSRKEKLELLNEIEDSKVISVNEKDKFIEIVYKKENEERYLTIEQTAHISSMNGVSSFFILDNKKLQDTKTSKVFCDINKIVKIFHLTKSSQGIDFRKDILEIIYKSSENKINSYRLRLNFDYDVGMDLSIQKYEDIFSFKTRVLDDKNKTQLLYSYCTQYFSPKMEYNYFEEVYDESSDCENLSPQITRKTVFDYNYDFPITTFGERIRFELEDNGGIEAYNISHSHLFNPLPLPNTEIYNYLNTEEKKKLRHFLSIAQMYLNDLYVNREFDNQFIINTFEKTKDDWKLDKLKEILENSNWVQKRYYDDAEQGHPGGMIVDIYYKEDDKSKKFIVFDENDWLSFKITAKYNDNVKDEVEELLKHVRLNVEVWWQDNYEILKGEFEKEYKVNSFKNTLVAVEFIRNELDKELFEIIKKNPTHNSDELLYIYKRYGTDFFLKNSKENFSSWKYVEQNIQRLIDEKRV